MTAAWAPDVSSPPKLFSSASQKRVAPLIPTMFSAPLTWCRWSGQLVSAPAASSVRTRSSAWSTSAVIHDRMVVSGISRA